MRRFSVLLAGALAAACGGGEVQVATITCDEILADLDARRADMTTTESGLMYEELAAGRGEAAEVGDFVSTHYTLCSLQGEEIDSSLAPNRGEPLNFTLGEMIAGFNEGVEGMKAGGRRILVLPPSLAYGQSPPSFGSDIVFHVQLMSVGAQQE